MATTKFYSNVQSFISGGHHYTTYEMHDTVYGLECHVDVSKNDYQIIIEAYECENCLAVGRVYNANVNPFFNPFRMALYSLACDVRMSCKSYDIDRLEPIMAEFAQFIEDNHLITILK